MVLKGRGMSALGGTKWLRILWASAGESSTGLFPFYCAEPRWSRGLDLYSPCDSRLTFCPRPDTRSDWGAEQAWPRRHTLVFQQCSAPSLSCHCFPTASGVLMEYNSSSKNERCHPSSTSCPNPRHLLHLFLRDSKTPRWNWFAFMLVPFQHNLKLNANIAPLLYLIMKQPRVKNTSLHFVNSQKFVVRQSWSVFSFRSDLVEFSGEDFEMFCQIRKAQQSWNQLIFTESQTPVITWQEGLQCQCHMDPIRPPAGLVQGLLDPILRGPLWSPC